MPVTLFSSAFVSKTKYVACAGAAFIALSFFAGPAEAACASPTANAGSLEWFTADLKFKYCDGTNWTNLGTGGLWTLSGGNLVYTTGNVGIGFTNPAVALDVNGSIRMGDSGLTCGGTYDGTLRYNATNKTIDFCDGTNWKAIAGSTISTCSLQEYSTPGNYSFTVTTGCTNLVIEAYGAGGGGAYNGQAGGGGGSSRVEDASAVILALGGGGGGGGYDGSAVGSGGGGGYGKKTATFTVGETLNIFVGGGGQNACGATGGPGGSPSGGTGGNSADGGNSTYGGGGGGDMGKRGGTSTYGGSGGGGSGVSNAGATTTYGGAGGSDYDFPCGVSTYGSSCGGYGEHGGGGYGMGDVALQGMAGELYNGGVAANGGPGTGGLPGFPCPTTGGNGKVVIRPI